MHWNCVSAIVAAASLGASASAAVLFSDTTNRRINDTRELIATFGPTYMDSAFSGTLYFRWTMSNFDTNSSETYPPSGFGLGLYNGSRDSVLDHRLSVGRAAYQSNYSFWANGGVLTSSGTSYGKGTFNIALTTSMPVLYEDVTTMVLRINFQANALDEITVFMNPDMAQQESAQLASKVTGHYLFNAAFSHVRLEEFGAPEGAYPGRGAGLGFTNVLIGESGADIGFGVVPAPGVGALLGLAGLSPRRRR